MNMKPREGRKLLKQSAVMAVVSTCTAGQTDASPHANASMGTLSVFFFFNLSPFGNLKPLNVSILMRFSKRERKKMSRIIRACGMLGGKQQGARILLCVSVFGAQKKHWSHL